MNLGHFDHAISNPPFGRLNRNGLRAPRYTGADFAYHVMDIAADIADFGAFILPRGSAPFQFSGAQYYRRRESRDYLKFKEQTGISLEAGVGIDTSIFIDDWKGVKPAVEIACCDFMEAREDRKSPQDDLFAQAA